jgi:hypothetical protein
MLRASVILGTAGLAKGMAYLYPWLSDDEDEPRGGMFNNDMRWFPSPYGQSLDIVGRTPHPNGKRQLINIASFDSHAPLGGVDGLVFGDPSIFTTMAEPSPTVQLFIDMMAGLDDMGRERANEPFWLPGQKMPNWAGLWSNVRDHASTVTEFTTPGSVNTIRKLWRVAAEDTGETLRQRGIAPSGKDAALSILGLASNTIDPMVLGPLLLRQEINDLTETRTRASQQQNDTLMWSYTSRREHLLATMAARAEAWRRVGGVSRKDFAEQLRDAATGANALGTADLKILEDVIDIYSDTQNANAAIERLRARLDGTTEPTPAKSIETERKRTIMANMNITDNEDREAAKVFGGVQEKATMFRAQEYVNRSTSPEDRKRRVRIAIIGLTRKHGEEDGWATKVQAIEAALLGK